MTLENICGTIYTHFYISIIVVSFIVNFAVFLKAAMNYKHNSSFQMILQLNLAVADALSSPFNLWQAFHNIGYNETTVCTVRCLKGVSVAGYAITLTAIALDRYLSLLLNRGDMTYGRRHALYVGGVWAVAFIMYMPLIFALHTGTSEMDSCFEVLADARIHAVIVSIVYIVTALTTTVCNYMTYRTLRADLISNRNNRTDEEIIVMKEKMKAARCDLFLDFLCFACFLPCNIIQVFWDLKMIPGDFFCGNLNFALNMISQLHSLLNPLLHYYFK